MYNLINQKHELVGYWLMIFNSKALDDENLQDLGFMLSQTNSRETLNLIEDMLKNYCQYICRYIYNENKKVFTFADLEQLIIKNEE